MMRKIFAFLLVSAALFSCKKEDQKTNVFNGPEVQVHNGKARTWIRLSKEGAPEQLAISITNTALNSMPEGDGNNGHNHENMFLLPLHKKATSATSFKYVGMDWNPSGHEPENIYTLPHFDFHYYMVPEAEVTGATDMAKMDVHPDAAYLPQTYFPGPPVPQMGKHWLDATAPELDQNNPATFTQTFIYGTYNGKVTFYEPMITLDFLKNTYNYERAIPQPAKFKQAGYYPTKMLVQKRNEVTEVILDGFVYRQAS